MGKKVIKEILGVENKDGYNRVHALIEDELGNLDEATAYLENGGKEYKKGERVEVFFHKEWNQIKFRRTKNQ